MEEQQRLSCIICHLGWLLYTLFSNEVPQHLLVNLTALNSKTYHVLHNPCFFFFFKLNEHISYVKGNSILLDDMSRSQLSKKNQHDCDFSRTEHLLLMDVFEMTWLKGLGFHAAQENASLVSWSFLHWIFFLILRFPSTNTVRHVPAKDKPCLPETSAYGRCFGQEISLWLRKLQASLSYWSIGEKKFAAAGCNSLDYCWPTPPPGWLSMYRSRDKGVPTKTPLPSFASPFFGSKVPPEYF